MTAYLLSAVALLAAGAALGYVLLVAVAIHREEADRSFKAVRSGRLIRGARAANGLYIRDQENVIPIGRRAHR
jgi:hypothetical protein